MNNQEMIDVIQAEDAGQTIEHQWKYAPGRRRNWKDKPTPGIWDFKDWNYRVKVQPIVIETWLSPNGTVFECVAGSIISTDFRRRPWTLHMARETTGKE